jgi:hypothetical protein
MQNFINIFESYLNLKHSGNLYIIKDVKYNNKEKELVFNYNEVNNPSNQLSCSTSYLMEYEPLIHCWPQIRDKLIIEDQTNDVFILYNKTANCYLQSMFTRKTINIFQNHLKNVSNKNVGRLNALINFASLIKNTKGVYDYFQKNTYKYDADFEGIIIAPPFRYNHVDPKLGIMTGVWLRVQMICKQLNNPIVSLWLDTNPNTVFPTLNVNLRIKISGKFIYPIGYVKINYLEIGNTLIYENRNINKNIYSLKTGNSYIIESNSIYVQNINGVGWDEIEANILLKDKVNSKIFKAIILKNPYGYIPEGDEVIAIGKKIIQSKKLGIRLKSTEQLRLHRNFPFKSFFYNRFFLLLFSKKYYGIVIDIKELAVDNIKWGKANLIGRSLLLSINRAYRPNVIRKIFITYALLKDTSNNIHAVQYEGYNSNTFKLNEKIEVSGILNKKYNTIFTNTISYNLNYSKNLTLKNPNITISRNIKSEGIIKTIQVLSNIENYFYQKYLCRKCLVLRDYSNIIWNSKGIKKMSIPTFRMNIQDQKGNIILCFFQPEWLLPNICSNEIVPRPPPISNFWESKISLISKFFRYYILSRKMKHIILPFPSILINNKVKFDGYQKKDGSIEIISLQNLTTRTISYKQDLEKNKYFNINSIPIASTYRGIINDDPQEVDLFDNIESLLNSPNVKFKKQYNSATGQYRIIKDNGFVDFLFKLKLNVITCQLNCFNKLIISLAIDPRVITGYYNSSTNFWEYPIIIRKGTKVEVNGIFSVNGVLVVNKINII